MYKVLNVFISNQHLSKTAFVMIYRFVLTILLSFTELQRQAAEFNELAGEILEKVRAAVEARSLDDLEVALQLATDSEVTCG